ncbi:MAG: hypothetical protein AB8B87_10690 [Granulosicoccus sp.]
MFESNNMQMLTLYRRLFTELEQQVAEYAVWKNIQELPEALLGSGDIDIYLYPGSRAAFLRVLRGLGFVRLTSHKAYPCVEHYYGYDENSGKFAHLHCYFRIVTGESHIKQYVVPIESYLNGYPACLNAQGIREIHPVLQKKLNIFRRKIKLSCLPGAILFFRERRGYRLEREMTTQSLVANQVEGAGNSALAPDGWLADIEESSGIVQEVISGLEYRVRYQQWNRLAPLFTPLYRYLAILSRLRGKLSKQKKTFPLGLSLAITGTDDASSDQHVEKMLSVWSGKHFSAHFLHFTLNKEAFAGFFPPVQQVQVNAENSMVQPILPLQQVIRLLWEGWCWRGRVRRSVRLCTAGSLVFWNPVHVEQVRRCLHRVHEADESANWVKRHLLQMSKEFFSSEPSKEACFRVTSVQGKNKTTSHDLQDDLATISVESSMSGLGDSFQGSESMRTSGDTVVIKFSDKSASGGYKSFRTALWETVAFLQP